jgi:hypothetical protein
VATWKEEWLVVEEQGTRAVPAFEWLLELPLNVRKQLLAIVAAVRSTGPDRWYDTTSHCPMSGDLAHVHEARDKQGETLYRLFLRWHREERRVVLLDGRWKPNKTVLAASEYEQIKKLADKADEDPPLFATAADFARLLLEEESENA